MRLSAESSLAGPAAIMSGDAIPAGDWATELPPIARPAAESIGLSVPFGIKIICYPSGVVTIC